MGRIHTQRNTHTHSYTFSHTHIHSQRKSGRRHLNNNNGIEKETISNDIAKCWVHRQLALAYSVKSELIWSTVTTTTQAAGQGRAQWFSSCAMSPVGCPLFSSYVLPLLSYYILIHFLIPLVYFFIVAWRFVVVVVRARWHVREELRPSWCSMPARGLFAIWWDRPLFSGTLHPPLPLSLPTWAHHFAKQKKHPPPFVGRGIWLQNTRKKNTLVYAQLNSRFAFFMNYFSPEFSDFSDRSTTVLRI